jgi:bacillithiol system protein YtxJ
VVELRTVQALDGVWNDEALVLFKHSTQCGRSAQVYEEVQRFAAEHREVRIHLVKVIEARPVSNEVERRAGVRHESPQVLIVKRGAVVWHEAHLRVTAAGMAAHLGDGR